MALECLYNFVIMNGPVQDHVTLLRCHQDPMIVMGMGQLLDFVCFHE